MGSKFLDSSSENREEEIEKTPMSQLLLEFFPTFLAMGMTYEQYWIENPSLVYFYKKAYNIKISEENTLNHLYGIYTLSAVSTAVSNAFSKSSKVQYVDRIDLPHELKNKEFIKHKEEQFIEKRQREVIAQLEHMASVVNSSNAEKRQTEKMLLDLSNSKRK